MCHLWPESRTGWPCSLPTCRTLPREDPSLPCWVWTRAAALYSYMPRATEGGLGAEANWKLWAQGYSPDKMLQSQRKWDKERQGDGCGHFPVLTSEGNAEGIGWLSPIAEPACCSHLLWAPVMDRQDRMDRHWFTLQGHTDVHQAHLSGSQTPWAEPQLELKHVFTQVGNSEDIFFPSTDAVVNLLAMYNVRFGGGSQFVQFLAHSVVKSALSLVGATSWLTKRHK